MVLTKGFRCLSLLSFLLLAVIVAAQADMEHLHEFVMNVAKSCQTDDLTEDDMKALLTDSAPTHEGKCFIACTMKELKLLNDEGDFSVDGIAQLSEKIHSDDMNPDEFIHVGETIAEKCSGLEGEDVCDTAFKIFQCGKAEYKAINA